MTKISLVIAEMARVWDAQPWVLASGRPGSEGLNTPRSQAPLAKGIATLEGPIDTLALGGAAEDECRVEVQRDPDRSGEANAVAHDGLEE